MNRHNYALLGRSLNHLQILANNEKQNCDRNGNVIFTYPSVQHTNNTISDGPRHQ